VAVDQRKLSCLNAMGITVWESRGMGRSSRYAVEHTQTAAGAVEPRTTSIPSGDDAIAVCDADLATLERIVSGCVRCGLHQSRTQTVFGVGAHDARLMIIGEAPGADEDRLGEPFVGRAGRLLNAMLGAVGLARGSVYIANIIKCRPPRNRDPKPDETASCAQYLKRQIELVRPKLILAVGRVAAQNLLGTTTAIGRLRGQIHKEPVSGTPLLVTYHPAYLLRSPGEKRKSWQDLKRARQMLEDPE
jgi:uracil-DNA glycosylase family 4